MMSAKRVRTRPYRSELRARQASETRARVVEAARELFARHGYAGTTVAQIARAAGVSAETVQKHGPKTALLQAAIEYGSFGVEGESDVFATDAGRAILSARDAEDFATIIGEMVALINAPSAGLWMTVVSAALGDTEVADYRGSMLAQIRTQVERVLSYADERGWLRRDVSFDELVEAVCIVTAPEGYVRFVDFDGRSEAAYKTFVARTLRDSVLTRER
jgi:AcrR family transcriptional regulator